MNIIFKVMDHEAMDGEQLIEKINKTFKISHWKRLFIFNGRPYQTIERYNYGEMQMAKCEWSTLSESSIHKIVTAINGKKIRRAVSEGFRVEDVTGYDIVDVYDGKYYIGTFQSITMKDGCNLYGEHYEIDF